MKEHMTIRPHGVKTAYIYGFCLLAALIPLLLCSKSSPLYPLNDWPDVNIFFTLGKGMVQGLVPYVDLMDHKGPYVYALGGLAYLLSNKSFLGYFLLEVLCMSAFLYYAWKSIRLYTEGFSLWILPFLCMGVTVSESFVHGGSLEQLSLGVFAYGLYSLLRFLREKDKRLSAGTLAMNGVLAGILLHAKFTLLGFYMAWSLIVFFVYLFRKGLQGAAKWKRLFTDAGIFLAGMALTALPWLVYFGLHGAVGDWLRTYFWDNIFGYSAGGDISFLEKCMTAVWNAILSLKKRVNWSYSLAVAVGCAGYVCLPCKRVSRLEKFSAAFLGFCMALGIFIGGTKHDYYGLPLAVFSVFFGIPLTLGVEKLAGYVQNRQKAAAAWNNSRTENRKPGSGAALAKIFACGAALAITVFGSLALSTNIYLMKIKKEDMPQFRFAEIIKQSEDQSLLNYGFLDGAFYTVLGSSPVNRYYCLFNLNRNQIFEEQNRYVEQGLTHFLVTWKAFEISEEELRTLPVVSEYYDLVDYQYFYFEGDNRTYALYKRKE